MSLDETLALWLSHGIRSSRGACLNSAVMCANGDSLQNIKVSSPQKGQCGSLQVPFEKVILREIKIPDLGDLWSNEIELEPLPQKTGIYF